MKKTIFACGLMMALLMGTSTMVSCNKDDEGDTSKTDGGGTEALKVTKETVTWNYQVEDMQLAREMDFKLAYYDGDGNIKTADVSALSQDGKFSVKVVADGTKAFKMGFVAVWFLKKPAEEYTAETYNFTSTITPTIVRTYNTGDKTIEIGASPYTQTGTLKAQPKSFLQKRIDAGYNYVSTFFGYSYSDGSFASISDKDLLQALGAEKRSN